MYQTLGYFCQLVPRLPPSLLQVTECTASNKTLGGGLGMRLAFLDTYFFVLHCYIYQMLGCLHAPWVLIHDLWLAALCVLAKTMGHDQKYHTIQKFPTFIL